MTIEAQIDEVIDILEDHTKSVENGGVPGNLKLYLSLFSHMRQDKYLTTHFKEFQIQEFCLLQLNHMNGFDAATDAQITRISNVIVRGISASAEMANITAYAPMRALMQLQGN